MLLVLLVVGRTERRLIERHRRLEAYSVRDFDLLISMIDDQGGVVWFTPNTLTEASNLLGQHGNPERVWMFEVLSGLIAESREVIIDSAEASVHPLFAEIGLADAALLEVVSPDRPLLTADGRLYAPALANNEQAAMNFNYRRESELVR